MVIFGKDLPKKNKRWFRQFDKVLNPKEVEQFICPGSVREAQQILIKLPNLTASDGKKISKAINYRGYELWWMNYDILFERFCLPYTQYRNLLFYLKDFDGIYLFQAPWPDLFRYFLAAYGRQCVIFSGFGLRKLLPIPFGIFIQFLLSMAFLPWLMLARPKLMLMIGDKLAPSRDYDFRMKFIYEELRKRNIHFIEFIRSMESWPIVLRHAWKRKRPVFYSSAVVDILQFFTRVFRQALPKFSSSEPEQYFWLQVSSHYLRNVKGTIFSILIIKFILRLIGVKAARISAGLSRTFHELLACKLLGIKTVGMMHGATNKYYDSYDFMPGFDGKISLSVDQYGLWSDWWKDYYLKNSDAYSPDQLFVSGPMRPPTMAEIKSLPREGKLRVLYVSEEVAAPEELLPYILILLEADDLEIYFKFRPYRDNLELQLRNNYPELYEKILKKTKILRGTMEEAISQCDVAVGSYSTAVLEALLQLKPCVFFWTNKWQDNFEIGFFAKTPQELVEYIKKSREISREDLKKLQERFFGNPYQNGSKWAVEQLIKSL